MSYTTAAMIGTALMQSRIAADLSQQEIARKINRSKRTVQSWESGDSSPDSEDIFEWFSACGASPLGAFQRMVHPSLYAKPDTDKTDKEIDAELATLLSEQSRISKLMLLYLLKGEHGSYPPAVLAEICANLHTPLHDRVTVCGSILNNYTHAQATGIDPVADAIQPPLEFLVSAYQAGREASRNGATGYISKGKE